MEWRGRRGGRPRIRRQHEKPTYSKTASMSSTPHGDIIDCGRSTPIDFAYHVHTNVGNRCRGAKVNNKLIPARLRTARPGEQVEILTAKQGGPSRDLAQPQPGTDQDSARSLKIRAWFKKQDSGSKYRPGQGKSWCMNPAVSACRNWMKTDFIPWQTIQPPPRGIICRPRLWRFPI